jgi:hypothetical protein
LGGIYAEACAMGNAFRDSFNAVVPILSDKILDPRKGVAIKNPINRYLVNSPMAPAMKNALRQAAVLSIPFSVGSFSSEVHRSH